MLITRSCGSSIALMRCMASYSCSRSWVTSCSLISPLSNNRLRLVPLSKWVEGVMSRPSFSSTTLVNEVSVTLPLSINNGSTPAGGPF